MSQPLRTSLAQITSSKHKRFEEGDVDVLWLCIVILAIIILGLVIWVVIWYNLEAKKKEEEEAKKKEEEEKEK